MNYGLQRSAVLLTKSATGTDLDPNYVHCKPYTKGPELSLTEYN